MSLSRKFIVLSLFLFFKKLECADGLGKVVFAVNAGGDAHTDVNGIQYQKDNLKVGISSDYGKHLLSVGRVHPNDYILYQTERYHHSTFGYDIPVQEDGNYVMVLKFSEVYFNAPNMKVFDVVLNGDHTIISDLDIHEKVGHGVAYDKIVPFEVTEGSKTLVYNGQESDIRGGRIRIEFIKGYRDNPKVNAVLVIKGDISDVPQLPPLTPPPKEEEEILPEPEIVKPTTKHKRSSGPRASDPYEDVPLTSTVLPVFIAFVIFISSIFFLCRL